MLSLPQERHKALEQMGVSVQSSGIRLDNTCPYLVNLNADPSLNELLVYYLKVSLPAAFRAGTKRDSIVYLVVTRLRE